MQKTVGNSYNNHYQNKGGNNSKNHYQNKDNNINKSIKSIKSINKGNESNHIQPVNTDYNILNDLKDYMLDNKNILHFTKHNIDSSNNQNKLTDKCKIESKGQGIKGSHVSLNPNYKQKPIQLNRELHYKPRQKDSLFWCFYILKNGISKYEMEIGNQHFVVEKQEKFKYIDMIRKNKDIIKMHKIKPLTFLEDDLANSEIISIKTFFALCVLEKINIILVDKRKIYETIMTDDVKIHIVHRNSVTYEHYIELDETSEAIQVYRDTYYKMTDFDGGVKSMSYYKVDDLLDLCKKLNIDTNSKTINKKLSKKDIYELLVLHF